VIVLERDPAPPPAEPVDAWERLERPGVNQFRLPGWIIGGEWVSTRQHVPENHLIDALRKWKVLRKKLDGTATIRAASEIPLSSTR